MAKKIPFNFFKEGQYLKLDIGKLKAIEDIVGRSIGDIIANSQSISLTTVIAVLTVGLHEPNGQLKMHTPKHYTDLLQKYFDENEDADIDEIIVPVFKALVSTGILGKAVYMAAFPEDATAEMKDAVKKDEEGKNV